jgi:hypothetical protein
MTDGLLWGRIRRDHGINLVVGWAEESLTYDISKDDVAVARELTKLLIREHPSSLEQRRAELSRLLALSGASFGTLLVMSDERALTTKVTRPTGSGGTTFSGSTLCPIRPARERLVVL